MSESIFTQLDKISRSLELRQKWHTQHPEFFRHRVLNIKVSTEVLKLPDFYIYLVPFCFQLHLSLSITTSKYFGPSDDNIISENIRMIERLGIPVIYATHRQ